MEETGSAPTFVGGWILPPSDPRAVASWLCQEPKRSAPSSADWLRVWLGHLPQWVEKLVVCVRRG